MTIVNKQKQQGIALLMALLLVSIITAIVAGVSSQTVFNIKRSTMISNLERGDAYRKISLNYAVRQLIKDANQSNYDAQNEFWYYRPPAYLVDEGEVKGYINELSSKFNLAKLESSDSFSQVVFIRLIKSLGYSQNDAKKIISLIESKNYYSVIGVLVAARFNELQINELIKYLSYLPINSDKVNINFVSSYVFAAYLDLTIPQAESILRDIKVNPIENSEDFLSFNMENNLNIVNITDNEGNETTQGVVESLFGFNSRFFQIISQIKIGESESIRVTQVDRIGNVIEILNQRVSKLGNE